MELGTGLVLAEAELAEALTSLEELESRRQRLEVDAEQASAEEARLLLRSRRLQDRFACVAGAARSHSAYAEETGATAAILQQKFTTLRMDMCRRSSRPDSSAAAADDGLGVRRAAVAWTEALRADVDEREARLARLSGQVTGLQQEVQFLRQRLAHETRLGDSLRSAQQQLVLISDQGPSATAAVEATTVSRGGELNRLQRRISELESGLTRGVAYRRKMRRWQIPMML